MSCTVKSNCLPMLLAIALGCLFANIGRAHGSYRTGSGYGGGGNGGGYGGSSYDSGSAGSGNSYGSGYGSGSNSNYGAGSGGSYGTGSFYGGNGSYDGSYGGSSFRCSTLVPSEKLLICYTDQGSLYFVIHLGPVV